MSGGGVYGGDEVGAIVIDAGHYTFRAGHAGEEVPRMEVLSNYGYMDKELDAVKDESTDVSAAAGKKPTHRSYIIDPTVLAMPRADVHVGTFLKDGLVEDWPAYEAYLDYTFTRALACESKEHPLLVSETPGTPRSIREKHAELLFENFANGRSNGLIIDSGASHTSVVPVYDGFCIGRAAMRSSLGGDLLTEQCRRYFEENNNEIIPSYMIGSKEAGRAGDPPNWTKRANLPEVTKSYHELMIKLQLDDFKQSVVQLCDTPFDPESSEKPSGLHYEFPSGYNAEYADERLKLAECLFDTSYIKQPSGGSSLQQQQHQRPIGGLVSAAVAQCDPDVRPHMYAGLVVTGGATLLPGFVERLLNDLNQKCPSNVKVKHVAAPSAAERRFGAWTGGSILASLGSFQQMWISRQEYDESGKSIVEKKCP